MFLFSTWLRLPITLRHKIASDFGISKTRPTHVVNMGAGTSELVDDGYDIKNVESRITVPSLQEYTGSNETDLDILWGLMVDKATGKPVVKVQVPEIPKQETPIKVVVKENPDVEQIKKVFEVMEPKKRGRPSKK